MWELALDIGRQTLMLASGGGKEAKSRPKRPPDRTRLLIAAARGDNQEAMPAGAQIAVSHRRRIA